MRYIKTFNQFINEDQADRSDHYNRRKFKRLISTIYTTPNFPIDKYRDDIDLIQDIVYPKNLCILIRMKLDNYYDNVYTGGDYLEDDSDDSDGSRGKYLYFVINANEIDTVYFGNYKSGDNIIDYTNLKIYTGIYGIDLSKLKKITDSTLKNKIIQNDRISNFEVFINDTKYYYHHKDGIHYIQNYNTGEIIKLDDLEGTPLDIVDKQLKNYGIKLFDSKKSRFNRFVNTIRS